MIKRLLAASLALSLAAQPSLAANLELPQAGPQAEIAPLPALQALLPAVPASFSESAQLSALTARLDALPPSAAVPAVLAARAAGPAFLASLQKTLSPYTAGDIRDMPVAQLEDLARRVMDGAAATAAAGGLDSTVFAGQASQTVPTLPAAADRDRSSPPPAARSLYLLSRPIEMRAQLGPAARGAWVVYEVATQAAKMYLLWKAGLHPAAIASVMSIEVIKAPAMITAQSLSDLKVRHWWKQRGLLKRLATTPGVERIAVLTSAETFFRGIVAARQDTSGLVFLESARPLESLSSPEFGAPLRVNDPSAARIRLSFSQEESESAAHWTPTLQQLLDRAPLAEDVAAQWRAEIARSKKDRSWLQRFFDFEKERKMKVSATLVDPSGKTTPLGILTQGSSTKRLLGITRWEQLLGAPPRPARALPLADTAVERGPRAKTSWRGWPGRLWKLFLGQIVVVR